MMQVRNDQREARCGFEDGGDLNASLSHQPARLRISLSGVLAAALAAILWATGEARSDELRPGTLGIVALRSWDEVDAQVATELILRKLSLPNPHTHGVFVKEVLPGMGGGVLKENDIIIRLANLKLDSETQWRKARDLLIVGKPVKIAFKRFRRGGDGSREWKTSIEDITPHSVADEQAAKQAVSRMREAAKATREKHLSDLRDYVAAFPDSATEPSYNGSLPVFPDGPKTVDGIEVQSKLGVVKDMIEACPEADIPLNELAPWVPGVTRRTLRELMPHETVDMPAEIRAIYEYTTNMKVFTQAERTIMDETEELYPGSFARLMSIVQMMFYLGPSPNQNLISEWEDVQRHFFTAEDVEAKTVRAPLEGVGKEVVYWKKDKDLWHRFVVISLSRIDIKGLRSKHPANIAKKQREAEQARQQKAKELVERGACWWRATCRICGEKWYCYGVMGEKATENSFGEPVVVIGKGQYHGGSSLYPRVDHEPGYHDLLWSPSAKPP